MTELNGSTPHPVDLDETAQEIQRLAAAIPRVTPVQEMPAPSENPFDQKAHDLLLKSIDQVSSDWVNELKHVRQNSERVEELVLQRAAKVKSDITALYLLGGAALAEAKRGDDVNALLANELDKLSEEPVVA